MNNINFKNLRTAGLLLISYLLVIPNVILLVFSFFQWDLQNKLIYMLANSSIYIISIILILFIYKKDLIKEFKTFIKSFKSNFRIGMQYWLYALLFMMLTNIVITQLVGGLATNEEANRSMVSLMPIFSIISMCFIGPFLEEMIFRKSFKDVFKNKQAFLVVSSLLFGGAHLLSALTAGNIGSNILQLLYIIPYGGIGYFFAKCYLETNTIFTSVMIHIFHNSLSVLLVLVVSLGM